MCCSTINKIKIECYGLTKAYSDDHYEQSEKVEQSKVNFVYHFGNDADNIFELHRFVFGSFTRCIKILDIIIY